MAGGVDWGIFDGSGRGIPWSEAAGAEGVAVDTTGDYGGPLDGALLVARPGSGGYAGNNGVDHIAADGRRLTSLVGGILGVHALAIAPPGPFGSRLHAASWASGRLLSIAPDGTTATLATGLNLTNYDANILAFSADGNVLFVADSLANRIVCIEPVPVDP